MSVILRQLANRPNTQIMVGLMWSFSAILVKELTADEKLDIFFISAIRSLFGIAFLLPLIIIKWSPDEKSVAPTVRDGQSGKSGMKSHGVVLLVGLLLFQAILNPRAALCAVKTSKFFGSHWVRNVISTACLNVLNASPKVANGFEHQYWSPPVRR